MEIKNYVYSVIVASVIGGILLSVVKSKNAYAFFIKLLAGLFVTLTVISPWKNFRITDIALYFDNWETISNDSVNSGVNTYNEALQASIIDRTQTYILEKASLLGAELTATVTVSSDHPPVPVGVELTGNISPYNKLQMKQIIVNDLGIPEDAQIWK